MTTTPTISSQAAYEELVEHRHYHYRGCAPDPDRPQYAAADDTLPLDAWGGSTEDGGLLAGERLDQQRRAKEICARCPVLAACRTYANSELPGGGLAEPDGIQGGQTSLERHRALIEHRKAVPAPVVMGPTVQQIREAKSQTKRALLRQLARETDAELVAYRAGMDLRTANWHRAALCRLLGLDKETASRQELLEAAVRHRILPVRTRIVPDGPWPIAAAPNTDGSRQRRLAPGRPVQLTIPGLPDYPRLLPTLTPGPSRPGPSGPPGRRLTLVRRTPAARPAPLLLPVRTLETRAA
ncbi:WhiB family transcriptional regulator [Streptomyces cinereoruber]|uniref:WhiB family transcriptional regulator n=1 Tax=Streptomyces cinereoruber TaxID=67260 RepID=UPI00362BC432